MSGRSRTTRCVARALPSAKPPSNGPNRAGSPVEWRDARIGNHKIKFFGPQIGHGEGLVFSVGFSGHRKFKFCRRGNRRFRSPLGWFRCLRFLLLENCSMSPPVVDSDPRGGGTRGQGGRPERPRSRRERQGQRAPSTRSLGDPTPSQARALSRGTPRTTTAGPMRWNTAPIRSSSAVWLNRSE